MTTMKPYKEAIKKSYREEAEVVQALVVKAIGVTTSQVKQVTELSEGAFENYAALPTTLPTLSSLEVSLPVKPGRLPTSPTSPMEVDAWPPSPMPVGPSMPTASLLRMVEMLATVAVDVSVFQDAGLVKRLLSLILLP